MTTTLEAPVNTTPESEHERNNEAATTPEAPLRSSHTSNFPHILQQLQASLVVSTYQAGKLILVRPEGEQLNTHFRNFNKPMGVAIDGNRLAIGTAMEISEFHNVPAAAQRIDEDRLPDTCFLPRSSHVTGDIQIHEMEWGEGQREEGQGTREEGQGSRDKGQELEEQVGGELWFVNTRFSCLCTRSPEHSFAPRWRPPFIGSLTPEDRCHLNGLGMVDGRPKYVTALGETDEPAAWRENKVSGGILMDVPSGEVVARGLSMPHSPRYYNDRLWVLNSGEGGMGLIDERTGGYEPIVELPGFTRGLSFLGRFAFVGLSQVRESAIFSGIRIADRPESERWSGVAVVDIVRGETVAWLRFEDAVQEVFSVCVLPGRTWPDVVNDNTDVIGTSYVLPDDSLQQVPPDWRSDSSEQRE